jgi:DUF4097 and DUF4098 domain-containing protein YvlB
MTLTRSLAALVIAGLVPAAAAAQPPVPPLPPAHAASHASAWLDRYQDSRSGPETTEAWSKTFKTGASGSLDLSNVAGDVVVTGGPGDEIKIDAVKRVRARDGGAAKALLGELKIEAVETGGRVEVRTIFPRGHDIHAEVDYTVQVPAGAAVAIQTVSGDIRASKVRGETRLESVSGNIVGHTLAQISKVKSVSGDVEVSDGAAIGGLSASTVSGSVVTRHIKAKAVDVSSVSGDIRLQEVFCERAALKSVSGDVQYDGHFAKAGRYEFTSHSGDVRVAVMGGVGFEITANSFSGDVRSELPGFTPAADDDDRPGRREVRATIGDGSALVVVKTFSGDLVVTGPGAKVKPKEK